MYVADTKRLTLAGARKMIATAVGQAEQAGIAITVAIADAGGNLVMLERMDGGRFHTVHSSTTKAVCAASNKRPRRSGSTPRTRSASRSPRGRTAGRQWRAASR